MLYFAQALLTPFSAHCSFFFSLENIYSRNNGFINMLRTMKSKALALGGEPALRAAVEQMAPAEVQEEVKEGGTMAARISEK